MSKDQVTSTRKAFVEWYEKKFNKPLPLYLPSEEKKKLKTQFEKETNLKYES